MLMEFFCELNFNRLDGFRIGGSVGTVFDQTDSRFVASSLPLFCRFSLTALLGRQRQAAEDRKKRQINGLKAASRFDGFTPAACHGKKRLIGTGLNSCANEL